MKKNVLVKSALLLAVMLFSFLGRISAQTWQQVDISELTTTDIFVIVDITSGRAMTNDNGTSIPLAVEIAVSGDQITSVVADNLKWNISGNATDGYVFYPNGSTTTWLYCISDNRGLRVGTEAEKLFTFDLNTTQNEYFLHNTARDRYIGVYNNQDWRSYTSVNNNIKNTKTRFFRYEAGAPSSVATPTFSPGGGTYYVPQTVSISCETEGAEIHYTLDGTTPDESSAVYSVPFTVSTSTTVKAIAYLGSDASNVNTVTYTFPALTDVATIAELRAQNADNSTLYRLTGASVVTFTGLGPSGNSRYTYIQDATAAMYIYDQSGSETSGLADSMVVSSFIGKLTTYNGMMELIPMYVGEVLSSDSAIAPVEVSLAQLDETYQAKFVKVMNVTFAAEETFGAASNSATYALAESDIVTQIRYRDNILSGTEIPTTPQNLTALVYQYNSTIELALLALEDYVPEPTDCENVPSMGTCSAVLDNRDMLFTGRIAVDDPACTLREYGFVYSTFNTMPDVDDEACTKVVLGTDIAAGTDFSYRLPGLGFETYYVRAFATNEVGTGYSDVTSILQAEPENYTVNFLANGYAGWDTVSVFSVYEGEPIMKFPIADDCGNLSFAGWALQPFEGQTEESPVLYTLFTPTSDTTFFAVFSSTSNVVNDEIVISRASFDNVAGYGTDDQWTAVSKVAGTEITGWCDLYTNDATMQMRVNTPYGSYPYNETALPGAISSITMYAAGNGSARQWTPWLSSTPLSKENHTDGVSLETQDLNPSSSVTWEVSAEHNATYFYIALSGGAAYVDSIEVAYTSADYLYTMLAVDTVTIDQTICEGLIYNENGFNTGEAGPHTYRLENNEYCATYYVLNLSLEQRDTIHHYVDTCDLYVLNNEEYRNSAEVDVVTPAEATYGCPVVDEWHITIRHSSESSFTVDTCEFYTWNDTTYRESGIYTQTFVNAEGCDSTVTLNLTVRYGTHNVTDTTVCESFTWHGDTYTVSDTYIYEYDNESGCPSADTLHLTVNYGTHNVTDTTVCGGFMWNGEMRNLTDTYIYEYENERGCASADTLHLTVNHGDYAEVLVDTCGTEFYWELADTTVTRSGSYYYYSENANTCIDTTVLNLSLHQAVTKDIYAQICEGETYNQNGFNVSAEGDYTLPLETIYGCDSTVTLHLTIGSETVININASICFGEDYEENGFSVIAPAVGNHEYANTIERPGTCDSIVMLHLTVNALPEIVVSGEIAFCEGGSTTLTATGAETYVWTLPVSADPVGNTAEYAATAAGTYTVTGTDSNNCVAMTSVEVTVNALPTITISGETVFCDGDNTTLTASGAETYSWGTNATTAEFTVYEGGTYTVTGTDLNGCENTATVEVTMHALPTVAISGETSFCFGGNTTLTASGATTYTWGNETTAELTVTSAGTYTVTGTDANGCVNTASVEVTVNTLPTVAISGETVFCEGGSTTLTASGATTYTWGDETTAELTVTEAGTYTVTGTDANGCENTASVEVTVNALPTVTISGETAFCEGGSTTLTATGATTYTWGDETTAEITVDAAGTYTVTGTDANGCENTASVEVTVNALPTVTISGETVFCEGGNTTLTATGATTYTWGNETTAELTVTEAGTYTVTGTDANGCVNTASVEVTMNTLPTVTISGDTSFCFGGSTVLTASGAATYTWGDETTAELTVTEAGTYTVTGTDANGCTNTASQEVTVITVNTEVYYVEVGDGFLEAIQENAEYQWIDCATNEPIEGATQSQFTPEVSGSYACVITVGECSDTSDCQDVTITGITEHGTADLTLYPNPTTGIVNIRLTPETCALTPEIHLFDIYGRRLQIMPVTAETIQIDLSRHATGVYLVKLVSDGKVVAVKKVVKE